ncbi:RDD family protein [Isoptericola sp. NEAU-Y5]|uniref:RDD family protein n=1 Tax=Isoptericola luteus TaxID=2879484 RepID=A0ABS7ZIB7_9MICO|nr:RDD family protein [Isoptericola sp. NEAU-Y5]MCA5894222.1 RDD family protein [Isoptericola sp. NEAU-Y5]
MTTTVPAPSRPSARGGDRAGGGRPAAWGRRVLATLLDSAVVSSATFLAVGGGPGLVVAPGLPFDVGDGREAGWAGATLLLLLAIQAYTGMTPGKRVVGISVVDDESGRPVGLWRTLVRWVAHLLDALLLIGYLRPLWHRERRTFADSMLHTVVRSTTTPRPHSWVTNLRRSRDARAPRLRWPRWVARYAAISLCTVAVAMSLTQGQGRATWGPVKSVLCTVEQDGGAGELRAELVVRRTDAWYSRLGVRRGGETTWDVGVRWSHSDEDLSPGGTWSSSSSVRFTDLENVGPDAESGFADVRDGGEPLFTTPPVGTLLAEESATTDDDVTSRMLTTSLRDAGGDDAPALATCAGPVPDPRAPSSGARWPF